MNLYQAVGSNDLNAAHILLGSGVLVNTQDYVTGLTPLALAASRGYGEMVRLLLVHGADPNFAHTTTYPLEAAAARGDVEITRQLLEAGAHVDARGEDGVTALIAASAAGHLGIVDALLEAGADPRLRSFGQSAARSAAGKRHWTVVERLLPRLSHAERREINNLRQMDAQALDPEAVQRFHRLAQEGRMEQLEQMLSDGMAVDAQSESGMTALMWAVVGGQLETVQYLLERGADLERTSVYGQTAFRIASENGEREIVEYLFCRVSAKERKRMPRAVAFLQSLPHQYPQWVGWQAPECNDRTGKKR